jgi:hypothetical protein
MMSKISYTQDSLHYYFRENWNLNSDNKIQQYLNYDFSVLFSGRLSRFDLGFIGDDFRRIRIKLISIIKSHDDAHIYFVYGKSNVEGNICEFQGTIGLKKFLIYDKMHFGVDDYYKNHGIKVQGVLIADYIFYEHPKQTHAGCFKGEINSAWYIDNDYNLIYDDIESVSDNWSNNQFFGIWTSYSDHKSEKCNWGHARIPESGDLDIGVAEFYPDEQYWDKGWEIYIKAYVEYPGTAQNKEARNLENMEWWK